MPAVRRRLIRDAWLVLPEVFEPIRRQGRVADRGHDRSVAEIGLGWRECRGRRWRV